MELRLEIAHEDPWGLLEVHEFRRGTRAIIDGELVSPWDEGWWVDGLPVDRDPIEVERGGHRFRIRLAPPESRTPRAPIRYQPWWGNATVLWLWSLPMLYSAGLPVSSFRIEERNVCHWGVGIEEAPPMGLLASYVPQAVPLPSRLRDPGGGEDSPAARGRMRDLRTPRRTEGTPVFDTPEGHPFALQLHAAIDERRADLALCFRASGAAGVRESGTLLVYGKVFSGGRVTPLFLERDDFDLPALSSCVREVFSTIRVPEPPDIVSFHYPVRFSV